ncbi:hypothetical protein GCM10027578_31580 [Spirosoma luteolum]
MKKLLLLLLLLPGLALRAPEDGVRVFLIGDSTCANKNPYDAPETGWGQLLPELFTPAVTVQNHAVNGRSTKSFRTLGHWKAVQTQLRKGDYVFIQFGHNDQKQSDTTRYAAPQTDYRANLIRYIEETQAKGAIPVLLTPVMRRKFDERGQFVDQHGEYPAVVRAVASQYHLTLLDLHASTRALLEQHGPDGSAKLFMHYGPGLFPKHANGIDDDTHFSPYGARLVANRVADALVQQGSPLRNFLRKTDFNGKYAYELPVTYRPYFRRDTVSIVRYGAKPDGRTLSTSAINQAIDQQSQAGGGTVMVPKGLWLTGPIVLKSNVNLYVETGALLQFSRNVDDYPIVLTTWEGQDSYRCQAPISGVGLVNVALTGGGIIDGGGDAWRAVKRDKLTAGQWTRLTRSGGVVNEKGDMWYPSASSMKGNQLPNAGRIIDGVKPTPEALKEIRDFLRPNMVSLTRCQHVWLDGLTFQNSPAWTLHPLLCEHITVRNVTVQNEWYAQNSDAIDLESCRNGVLEGCRFATGDDGITIKSGRDEQGRARGIPTENIVIRDCIVYHAHGGFVIGSEMSGGVRNLYVSDCTFMGSDVGLRFKTTRGRGGVVEDIYVSNVNMTNIPGEAILFDMYYAAKDPVPAAGGPGELPVIQAQPINAGTPQFRNFFIKNIVCKGAETGILMRGLPEMAIRNIQIENAMIECNKGLVCVEAADVQLRNVTLLTQASTVMQVQNSKNVVLDQIGYTPGKALLLSVLGDRSAGVRLLRTDGTKATKDVELGSGVKAGVLSRR